MARAKKQRGRPASRPYPPQIDATLEEIAHIVLNASRPKHPFVAEDYPRVKCERQVAYPETLYNDGKCAGCRSA